MVINRLPTLHQVAPRYLNVRRQVLLAATKQNLLAAIIMSETPWHTITIRVPFANPKHATIAMQVIDVDPELQREAVKRTLTVDGNDLVASFATSTVRLARLTTNGFLENVDLVARTIGEFGEDSERKQVISR